MFFLRVRQGSSGPMKCSSISITVEVEVSSLQVSRLIFFAYYRHIASQGTPSPSNLVRLHWFR